MTPPLPLPAWGTAVGGTGIDQRDGDNLLIRVPGEVIDDSTQTGERRIEWKPR